MASMTHRDSSAISVATAAFVLAAGPWLLDAWLSRPPVLLDLAGFGRISRQALESEAVGQAVVWHDAKAGVTAVITPATAFRDQAGRWCRPYDMELAATNRDPQARRRRVACRTETGIWTPPPEQVAETGG